MTRPWKQVWVPFVSSSRPLGSNNHARRRRPLQSKMHAFVQYQTQSLQELSPDGLV